MTVHEKQLQSSYKEIMHKGLGVLFGVTIGAGVLSAACLANSAATLLAGTGLGSFIGERANEKVSLGVFAMTAIVCGLILFLRSLYFTDKVEAVIPIL